jgi:hypothetical protein
MQGLRPFDSAQGRPRPPEAYPRRYVEEADRVRQLADSRRSPIRRCPANGGIGEECGL